MKTIKQIADEIGVSKTAVRKKMTDEMKTKFAQTIGNTIYISLQGENLIKSSFLQDNENQVCANQSETSLQLVSDLVSTLQTELEIKNQQIQEQSKIILEQSKTIENLSNSLQSAQALHAGTIHQQIVAAEEEPEQKQKKSFWVRFGRKNYK